MRLPSLQYRFDVETEITERFWKDDNFRKKLEDSPNAVLSENFNMIIPSDYKVKVLFEEENEMILVIPNENLFSKNTPEK